MAEEFRSLSDVLLGALALTDANVASLEPEEPNDALVPATGNVAAVALEHPRIIDLLDSFIVELTRLTARAAEHLEERAEALLADLAQRVLGRELRTTPVDVAALVAQTLADFSLSEPFVVRVASADAERLGPTSSVRIDTQLAVGDFAIDVADGSYELRLQTRLEAMLASHRIAL